MQGGDGHIGAVLPNIDIDINNAASVARDLGFGVTGLRLTAAQIININTNGFRETFIGMVE